MCLKRSWHLILTSPEIIVSSKAPTFRNHDPAAFQRIARPKGDDANLWVNKNFVLMNINARNVASDNDTQ